MAVSRWNVGMSITPCSCDLRPRLSLLMQLGCCQRTQLVRPTSCSGRARCDRLAAGRPLAHHPSCDSASSSTRLRTQGAPRHATTRPGRTNPQHTAPALLVPHCRHRDTSPVGEDAGERAVVRRSFPSQRRGACSGRWLEDLDRLRGRGAALWLWQSVGRLRCVGAEESSRDGKRPRKTRNVTPRHALPRHGTR